MTQGFVDRPAHLADLGPQIGDHMTVRPSSRAFEHPMPYAPDLSGLALDDRYELHAPIGEGAFGRVYRGRDRRLERSVAVKVIKPWWAEEPDWVETFARETRMLARVSDPGIVQIFDVGHAPEGLYYVSELVDGEDLARRLLRGPLPPWQACAIAGQLCRALARAHRQRIVHRDVKPANILLSHEGRVKVGDFGVARLAEGSEGLGSHAPAATIVGTPKYMAPEQGRGRPTTSATDVYSVGVVLYEMLAGRPPFTGATVVGLALSHIQEQPPPLSAGVPASLAAIVDRAMAKDPADRFADGAEMADALVEARREAADRSRRPAMARARTRAHASAIADPVPAGSTATALLEPRSSSASARARSLPPRRPADETRLAAPGPSPRRNVNPPARRRALAAFFAVVLLLAGMVTAAVLLNHRHTRVPRLTGLSRSAARARARHLDAVFSARYSPAAKGTVIAQRPRAGTRVAVGTPVRLTLSRGPAPVEVPVVGDASSAAASDTFSRLGLHTTVTQIAAPGIAPGTVIRTSPGAGRHLAKGSTVALFVAETPRWRPLATITDTRPATLRIRGTRWRVVYTMAYHGTCTWIFFCSGPHVRISSENGSPVASFAMNDGDTQIHTFAIKPGTYQVKVMAGGDEARWSMQVQDDY
jgi:eukaryotic-like serine/threonine-protein kinase